MAKELGVPAFTYGHIMIDKSKTEMAAVHLLELSGDALGWLLCYFHMLQDWERFLTSAESGVVGREAQHSVMLALARLAHCREESAFKAQVGKTASGSRAGLHRDACNHNNGYALPARVSPGLPAATPASMHPCCSKRLPLLLPHPHLQLELLYSAHAAYPAVRGRMKSAWEPLAERWAWYGRVELLDLRANTNNPVERCFGLVKYTDLGRKTQSTIQELVDTLLSKTVARNMHNRGLMLAGRTTSEQQRAEQRAEQWVEQLVAGGAVHAASPEGSTTVRCESGSKKVCVGDLSCSCSYSGERVGRRGLGSRRHAGVMCELQGCRRAQHKLTCWSMYLPLAACPSPRNTSATHRQPPPTHLPVAEYVCIHIAAAARLVRYTPALRNRAATYLVESALIQVEEGTGICCCPALGDPMGKSITFRPADGFCTCHGFALHNTCCHLLAAAQLPNFQAVNLPVMVEAAEVDDEAVSVGAT